MLSPQIPFTSLLAFGGAFLLSLGAHARERGIDSLTCRGCHGVNEDADLQVQFSPAEPEPGDEITLTIALSAPELQTAGLAIQGPETGEFVVPQGQPLTIAGRWVTHNQPVSGSSGQAMFEVIWRSPDTPGAVQFNVAALAANGDRRSTGDRAAFTIASVAYGCEPLTLYQDADGDGVGSSDLSTILSCELRAGYSTVDGDCDESRQTTFPGAPEMCNGRDDNCDGEIDENASYKDYYLDSDGDGFGDGNFAMHDCAPPLGYVDNALDCNDADGSVHPDAPEVCDYADNNCDGRVDDGVRERCGIGLCLRESEFCGAQCIAGEPLEERCNGLDDDCDGEIDESGCAEGEQCVDRVCVPATASPDVAPSTSTPSPVVSPSPGGATVAPVTDAPSTPSPATSMGEQPVPDDGAPRPAVPGAETPQGSGPSAASPSGSSSPGNVVDPASPSAGGPPAGGCLVAQRQGGALSASVWLLLGLWWRRRKHRAREA